MSHIVEAVRSLADLAKELQRLPDDAAVDWGTAAAIVSPSKPKSRKTMERWRKSGEGPPFIPGPGRTSEITYLVGDIRKWMEARRARTTIEVHARRGLTFASLPDLIQPQVWIEHDGQIAGHALTVTDADLQSAMRGSDGFRIAIASVEEVMTERDWIDRGQHEAFSEAFEGVMREVHLKAEARALAAQLDRELPAVQAACPKCGKVHSGRCGRI